MDTDIGNIDKSYLSSLRQDLEPVIVQLCNMLSNDIRLKYDNVGACEEPMYDVYMDYVIRMFEFGVLQFDVNTSRMLYISSEHYISFFNRVLTLIPSWIVTDELRDILDLHMQIVLSQRECCIGESKTNLFLLPSCQLYPNKVCVN